MYPSYAELHCVSNFSFLRGASHPEELVERALELGYHGLALTDECSFAGSVRAHLALRDAREHVGAAQRFRLIHGTEIQLADGPKIVLLATSRTGYGNLAELVTLARRAATKGKYLLTRAGLEAHAGLLRETLALLVPPAGLGTRADPAPLAEAACWLKGLAADPAAAWILAELTRGPDDAAHLSHLRALAQRHGLPLAAAGDVHMHRRARKPLADALAAVRLKTPLAQCGTRLPPNAERHLRPLQRLARIYPLELLLETMAVAERCAFSLDELRYEYPEEIVPPGHTPASWLRQATFDGAAERYPGGIPERVRAILEHELALICELRYEPYFLTVHDIVRFARAQRILCQGRGSAANSAVCYCLGITEVDPARMSVLFERFISKERNEPPDIDVDFEHQRREEVMQYIYAKYGRDRAALTAALHTYRPRGAVRDIGKALGLSLDQVDRLAKSLAWWDGRRIAPDRLREAGFDPDNPLVARVVALAHELIGFPRHLSQHSGGFVVARDRLSRLVPIENAAMPDRTVIEWDKDDLDALGLLKIDVLALGMLSCVRRALDHIERFRGAPMRLSDIPAEDPRVYDMLCRGDSLGVFQVESRAQMNMLPRLQPRCYYDLVIETAIVRPGPIQGGMVHPYLRRRQKIEPVTYPSDAVRSVLERTLGVSIFQEQVMQLAVVAAGFTPGEADRLRRAMAAWKRKGGLGPFRDKLIAGMLARGYGADYAEQIFRQIQGFGEYGFPESHAASFGLLVYVSSWLKCHEPAAFCAALLDSQPLGFYGPAQIVRDAVNHGVEVRPICIAASAWHCTLEPSTADPARPAVRLGLELVHGFPAEAAQRLVAARAQRPFSDAADLALRAQLARGEISRLAAADALAAVSGHRRRALWATLGVDAAAPRSAPLTAAAPPREAGVDLLAPTEGQEIVADYAHTALTLRRHPLALLRERLGAMRLVTAASLAHSRDRQPVRTAGIVTCRQRPATASGVTFVTLEDETGTINVVVWRTTAERWRRELIGATLLTVYGHVEREGDVIHVIAGRLVDHSALLGGLTVGSRDFH
ncbi:MAG TPA: error-prone DNA polymerase [Burkholderiaceae bacterium]|nr:error-prone DNA polymerase [Burkholderiaceae bacterium]